MKKKTRELFLKAFKPKPEEYKDLVPDVEGTVNLHKMVNKEITVKEWVERNEKKRNDNRSK